MALAVKEGFIGSVIKVIKEHINDYNVCSSGCIALRNIIHNNGI